VTPSADRYEDIASEYYDAERHPTSANFREASAVVLRDVLPGLVDDEATVVEVGCGRSLVMEVLDGAGIAAARAILVDSSPTMLAYSEPFVRPGVELLLGDAEHLPLPDGDASVVISVLGDPYNTPAFWREVRRVLRPGGRALYTTPSFDWSVAFRGGADAAEFDRADGDELALRSVVLDPERQSSLMAGAGLRVLERWDVPLAVLTGPISAKLDVLPGPSAPVVTAYLAERDPEG
jgi:SAM-dependent methyltransferase